MPLYLLHGFKWGRTPIVVHIVMHYLDLASPLWIMSDRTSSILLTNFRQLWPDLMAQLPGLRFVEQYDPMFPQNLSSCDSAFVADKVVECGLSVDVSKLGGVTMGNGGEETHGAFEALRDKVMPGAEIGWWIVYNGDQERNDVGDEEREGGKAKEGEGKQSIAGNEDVGRKNAGTYERR